MMRSGLPHSMFDVAGMAIKDITDDDGMVRLTISPVTAMSACPGCGTRSGRIHSRYHRRLADLQTTGRRVELVLRARRFFCDAVLCGRRVFTGASIPRFWRLGPAGRRAGPR
ncbi:MULTISPECIES: transposase family protein [Niveispirillum]|uniref:Transposase IS204/IS1001/IS1096/IS1165 zinc-finger domain-containing protein n=2 Tax=Niveispirillum TaxID=1543704 RepID=A0A255Z686_9PROT|nr:hypothetical protein C0V82_12765 [Niveispirillum cyanobacteriorum]OYQ37053.1 hypothetical protein CHU95_02450 [Niveispirillum lacus]